MFCSSKFYLELAEKPYNPSAHSLTYFVPRTLCRLAVTKLFSSPRPFWRSKINEAEGEQERICCIETGSSVRNQYSCFQSSPPQCRLLRVTRLDWLQKWRTNCNIVNPVHEPDLLYMYIGKCRLPIVANIRASRGQAKEKWEWLGESCRRSRRCPRQR